MTTVFWGVLIFSLSVLLAVGGLVLVQSLVPLSLRESHNTAIGIIYAALYVMFGMVVGFSAYLVLNKYSASQNAVELEANSVEELYWLAEQLPEPEQDQIQQLVTSYARTVVDEEWPLMEQGQASPRAEALANELRGSVQGFEPGTGAEQALYSQGLERVHEFTENRGIRLLNARVGLPLVLWFVLVSLGIDTILFTYFVGMKSARLHVVAVAALTAGITLILFTITVLDSPFGSDFRVSPYAFETTLNTIEGSGEQ